MRSRTPTTSCRWSPGRRTCPRARRVAVWSLGVMLCFAGCRAPLPPPACDARVDFTVFGPDVPRTENGYRLVGDHPTQGRFPCTLAIARLERASGSTDAFAVVDVSPFEQAHWVETFRGCRPIRDLCFLSARQVKLAGDPITGLLTAARGIQAQLLLLHVPNHYAPHTVQVIGVVYEVASGRPLAALHAESDLPPLEEDEPLDELHGDHRAVDPRYQAARQFEQTALACVGAQVNLDHVPADKQPHRWLPLYPYCWQPLPSPRPVPAPDEKPRP